MWEVIARFCSRYAILVIGLWVAAAAVGNLLVPQLERTAHLHTQGFLPADSRVNIAGAVMGAQFGDGKGGNLNYLVLESDHRLGLPERAFHEDLVANLRGSHADVESAMDLWSDPLTAQGAQSNDGKAAYTMLRLTGDVGSTKANDALAAVRLTVARHTAPLGLRVYVTGPGATIADEFTAIDQQMLQITAVTVLLIMLLLLAVYRSLVTAVIPLLTVGLGLAVARSIVSLLGGHGRIEVSIFSVALLAAMVLGAATDYGIFLIGRYHEARRNGADHEPALQVASGRVAPVIVASALTIAVALSCLTLAEVGMLRSAGLPCAIGILTGMLASLTLLPALIGIAGRKGFAQPRKTQPRSDSRWRRVGTVVARWPGPILVLSTLVLIICAAPVAGLKLGFNELAAQPEYTPANLGYQAMDRHFPQNRLLPEIVSIEAEHDMRNPAGVIAIERVTSKIMEIPGVTMVQSASRPAGSIPDQATFTSQAGIVGDQLDNGISQLRQRLSSVDQLSDVLAQFASSISTLQSALSSSVNGLGHINGEFGVMGAGMQQLQGTLDQVSGDLDPFRRFINRYQDCPGDIVCSWVSRKIVEPMDTVVTATDSLTEAASRMRDNTANTVGALASSQQSTEIMRGALAQLNSVSQQLVAVVGDTRTMFSGLNEYLQGVRQDFQNSSAGGYYLPQRAWADPRFQHAAKIYFSPDGRAARILVYGEGQVFGTDGAQRAPQILAAVRTATKEGTLAANSVQVAGFGTATSQLHEYVTKDFKLLAAVALAAVFLIVLVMLRSPVAAAVVIATVVISYLSALGISTFIWHGLLGREFHWAVPSIALIALLAVGADYNLLLTMRMREEMCRHGAGLRTGMIRTFGGTGGVVTTAGIVFGITMFAMLSSDVLSIEQVGSTVGIGLIIDTLVVRTFVVPAMAGALGTWFWWSPAPLLRGLVLRRTKARSSRTAGSR